MTALCTWGTLSTSEWMVDMDQPKQTPDIKQPRFPLSQETVSILTVGIAIVGIIFVNMGEMRAEARADRARSLAAREAMRAETQADRARIEALMNVSVNIIRAEGRADRDVFARQIARLVEQQGNLNGLVDGLRYPIHSTEE